MKRTLALLVVIVLAFSLAVPAFAAELPYTINYNDKAEALNKMGLFNGTAKGYELDRTPNRLEASVMLIRLLGKEQEALKITGKHPFKDVPAWADKYVTYMYTKKLSNGVSKDLYGAKSLCDSKMYITFVLRALGFDDTAKDFEYSKSIEFATNMGLITEKYEGLLKISKFYRDDMVAISYAALLTEQKDDENCLLQKLIDENAVDREKAQPYANIFKKERLIKEAQQKDSDEYYDTSYITTYLPKENGVTLNEFKVEENLKMIAKGYNDADIVAKTTYTSQGRSMDFYQYLFDGYLYYTDQNNRKVKQKMSFAKFYGIEEDETVDPNQNDTGTETPDPITGILEDDRAPVDITINNNFETIITTTEKGETAIEDAKRYLEYYFYDDYTEDEYKNASVSVKDVSNVQTISKEGYLTSEIKTYNITAYIAGNKITMTVYFTIKYNNIGQKFTLDKPFIYDYIEVTPS